MQADVVNLMCFCLLAGIHMQRAVLLPCSFQWEQWKEIQNKENAGAFFVLPSQMNAAEYPDCPLTAEWRGNGVLPTSVPLLDGVNKAPVFVNSANPYDV